MNEPMPKFATTSVAYNLYKHSIVVGSSNATQFFLTKV